MKYASGSLSFSQGVSQTIYGNPFKLKEVFLEKGIPDPYYFGMIVFGTISIIFSMGNIENTFYLQLVTTVLRFLSIFLMIGTSFISLFIYGISSFSSMNYFNFGYISVLFGNSVFTFMSHHSVSGIVYPIRPQSKIKNMFLYSFALGGGLLMLEGFLAALAFSWV